MNATAHVAEHYLAPFRKYLDMDGVTEFVINQPGECIVETPAGWATYEDADLSFQRLEGIAKAIANHTNQQFKNDAPILSATLPTGERIQVVREPAVEPGTMSFTVRKPSAVKLTLEDYQQQGAFANIDWVKDVRLSDAERERYESERIASEDRELLRLAGGDDAVAFLRRAIALQKNIVISGSTGSGKTTLMKSLVSEISDEERLLSIENVDELGLRRMGFNNAVPQFYSATGSSTSALTQRELMQSALRMRPDRVFVAELIRGDEAFDFMQTINSGHPGSITSLHANSTHLAWARLALLLKQSEVGAGLDYDVIRAQLAMTIEIIVQIDRTDNGREVTEVYYDPAATLAAMES